jgi:hypothetical protein
MVIGYINGMEIYYNWFGGKGAPLGGYFVTGRVFRYMCRAPTEDNSSPRPGITLIIRDTITATLKYEKTSSSPNDSFNSNLSPFQRTKLFNRYPTLHNLVI